MDGMGIGISEIQGVYFSGDIYIYMLVLGRVPSSSPKMNGCFLKINWLEDVYFPIEIVLF